MPSFDYLFALGIIGFYLYDSVMLIFYNEFLLCKKIKNHFHYQFSSKVLNISKRYLIIPYFFSSHQLIFQSKWDIHKKNHSHLEVDILNIQKLSQTLKLIQILNIFSWFFTLILLPICLVFRSSHTILAIIICLVYSINFISWMIIVWKRQSLNLSRFKIFHLLLDALLCPPFAVNLIRKISLNQKISSDGVYLARHFLTAQDFQQFLDHILKDLKLLKQSYPDNDANFIALELKEKELLAYFDNSIE